MSIARSHRPSETWPIATAQALRDHNIPWHRFSAVDEGWIPATDLCTSQQWELIAGRYRDSFKFPTPTPAAACSLQSYAGRFMAVFITTWATTGWIPTPVHDHWEIQFNERGSTIGVASANTLLTKADSSMLADALVAHFAPIVTACREAVPVSRRTAWGCITASASSRFGNLTRAVGPDHAPQVHAAAEVVHQAFAAQPHRPLVTWNVRPEHNALQYNRLTCCEMRQSTGNPCGSCPRISQEERDRRQLHYLTTYSAPKPVAWGVA